MAAEKTSDMMTARFRTIISKDLRKQTAENLKTLKSFSYLGSEKIGSEHFVLDGTLSQALYYKMVTGNRTVYYTFRLTKDGQVGFILTDE